MVDFAKVRAAKLTARSRLLAIPGVHAIGIGAKTVAGQRTSQPAIIVYTRKKLPVHEVPQRQLIPSEIDGVATDVVECPPLRLEQEDPGSYRPIVGGSQVEVGATAGGGTLGCIGIVPPNGKVVAITNQHVVADREKQNTTLAWSLGVIAGGLQLTLVSQDSGGNNVPVSPAGTTVYAALRVFPSDVDPPKMYDIFVQSVANDSVNDVAEAVADAVIGLGDSSVTATASGGIVAITAVGDAIVLIDPGAAGISNPDVIVHGPPQVDPEATLRADVGVGSITFSGEVSDDSYGVYVTVNRTGEVTGGSTGAFAPLQEDQNLSSVATAVADALNQIASVSATANGPQVSLAPVDQLECIIWRDVRVGQPTNSFASACSACCSDQVGAVLASSFEHDVALVELDAGEEYKAEILEIGFVTGVHSVTEQEAMNGLPIKKRGRSTRLTNGIINAIDVDGTIGLTPRRFVDAMMVSSAETAPDHYSEPGDSGSALVRVAGAAREVVGIHFAGDGAGLIGAAMPIQPILVTLGFEVATATADDQVHEVPEVTGAASIRSSSNGAGRRNPIGPARAQIHSVEAKLAASMRGEHYVNLVHRHAREALALVDRNRRVGVAWQRNGGPLLVRAVLQMLTTEGHAMPREILGKPLDEAIVAIAGVFKEHASQQLSRDLEAAVSDLSNVGGKTLEEVLDLLRLADHGGESSRSETV